MRRRPLGASTPHLPIVTLILIFCLGVVLNQLTLKQPWSPPFQGQANLEQQVFGFRDWQVGIDPRGWERVLRSSGLLAGLVEPQLELGPRRASNSFLEQNVFSGSPRAVVHYQKKRSEFWSELYQSQSSPRILCGPLKLRLPSGLYKGQNLGSPLHILSRLPEDVDRVVVVDPRGLQLPPDVKDTLLEQWERWEFDPFVDLGGCLGDTLCYARWRGQTLLTASLEKPNQVSALLQGRYPKSVIKTTARWAFGSRITGFAAESKPAWFIRGEDIVGTPGGGISYLTNFLQQRLGRDGSLQAQSPFMHELQELATTRKGWHVCLIERPVDQNIHWAVLLNFSETDSGRADGFLVMEIKQDNDT